MKKIVKLTESDLVKLVKRVIKEQHEDLYEKGRNMLEKHGIDARDMDELDIFSELSRLFLRVRDWETKNEVHNLLQDIESKYGELPTNEFIKRHQKSFKRRGSNLRPSSDDSFQDMMDQI